MVSLILGSGENEFIRIFHADGLAVLPGDFIDHVLSICIVFSFVKDPQYNTVIDIIQSCLDKTQILFEIAIDFLLYLKQVVSTELLIYKSH